MKWLYPAFICLSVLCLFASSCNHKGSSKCGPCPAVAAILPHLTFRVVDKTSSRDLFFGAGARYKVSQLKMRHIVNGIPDSAYFQTDTVNHFFIVFVSTAHHVDTVTMQIANLPQDVLLFNTSVIGDCCKYLTLGSVLYNGATVFTAANGPNIVVLTK